MKHLSTVVLVGVVAWRIGDRLDVEAYAYMTLGMVMGVLVGLSIALFVLAQGQRLGRGS